MARGQNSGAGLFLKSKNGLVKERNEQNLWFCSDEVLFDLQPCGENTLKAPNTRSYSNQNPIQKYLFKKKVSLTKQSLLRKITQSDSPPSSANFPACKKIRMTTTAKRCQTHFSRLPKLPRQKKTFLRSQKQK